MLSLVYFSVLLYFETWSYKFFSFNDGLLLLFWVLLTHYNLHFQIHYALRVFGGERICIFPIIGNFFQWWKLNWVCMFALSTKHEETSQDLSSSAKLGIKLALSAVWLCILILPGIGGQILIAIYCGLIACLCIFIASY